MYFHIELSKPIRLSPLHFGPKLGDRIKQRLHAQMEGTCSGKHGYVVTVTEIISTGKGRIIENQGDVEFHVKFKAIVFKPFVGEVLDVQVTSVSELGFFGSVGPLTVYITHQKMGGYVFEPDAAPQQWVAPNATSAIQVGSEVRVKISSMNIKATELFCIGTISEDCLGVI